MKYLREDVVNDIIRIAEDYAYLAGANWQSEQDETFIEHVELNAYSNGFKDAINKACEWLKSYRQDTYDGIGYIAGIVNDKTIEEFRKAMEN